MTQKIPKQVVDALFTENLEQLFEAFKKYGFEVRIVGGAVRDLLMKGQARDIDLATESTPDETMYILDKEFKNLDVLKGWGIQHGTIVVGFTTDEDEMEEYEISSLDFSIKVEDNKIVISQQPDWEADAKRRDFTINAMSIDREGIVHDYLDGVNDLKNQRIKFIGDYKQRILDDPKMILRFFKLIAKFPEPEFDKGVIPFIKEHSELLNELPPSTVRILLMAIHGQPYGDKAFTLMDEAGIDTEAYLESATLFDYYFSKVYLEV